MNIKDTPIFRDAKCLENYTGTHNVESYISATNPMDNVYVDFQVNLDSSKANDMIEEGKIKPFDTTQDHLIARTYIKRDASNDKAYCRTFLFSQDEIEDVDTFILYDIGDITSLMSNFPFVTLDKVKSEQPAKKRTTSSAKAPKEEISPIDAAAQLRAMLSNYDL